MTPPKVFGVEMRNTTPILERNPCPTFELTGVCLRYYNQGYAPRSEDPVGKWYWWVRQFDPCQDPGALPPYETGMADTDNEATAAIEAAITRIRAAVERLGT